MWAPQSVCHAQPVNHTPYVLHTLHAVECLFIEIGKEGVSLRKSLEIQYAVQLWCVIACKILISIQPLGKAQEMAWPLSPLSLASSWLWQTTLSGEQKGVIHAIFHSKCLSGSPFLGFQRRFSLPWFLLSHAGDYHQCFSRDNKAQPAGRRCFSLVF